MDKIAILGAGNIGEALISGLISSGTDPRSITATCRSTERTTYLAERYGISVENDNRAAIVGAHYVFLCVKPAQVPQLIEEIGEDIAGADEHVVIISMAAGVSLAAVEEAVPAAGAPVVRVMPNTPMLVGKGVLAAAFGRYVAEDQREAVRELLAAAGELVVVDEAQMDAVTAISGSGPAYFFLLAEALIDAGVSLGLPRDLATQLVRTTCAGAGKMLEQGGDPAALRAAVSSPAGTTVAAVREFEESGLRGAVYRATEASARRSHKLGHPESH